MQKYFAEVSSSDDFVQLELAEVCEILSRDELHVTSEEQVKYCDTQAEWNGGEGGGAEGGGLELKEVVHC